MTTPSKLTIVPENIFNHPACVLSCSAVPTLPIDNLKNPKRGRIARIPCDPAFEIKATWGGMGVYLSALSLLRCNFEPAATWRIQAYTAAADWTGANVDTGVLTAIDEPTLGEMDFGVDPLGSYDPFYAQKFTLAWLERTLTLSLKITVNDTGNSAGRIDISRAFGGDYFQVGWNLNWGFRLGWQDNSEIFETDGGSPHIDATVAYRPFTFDLGGITEAARSRWMSIFRVAGNSDFLICPYPGGTSTQIRDYFLNAIFRRPLPDLTTDSLNENSTNVSIREV